MLRKLASKTWWQFVLHLQRYDIISTYVQKRGLKLDSEIQKIINANVECKIVAAWKTHDKSMQKFNTPSNGQLKWCPVIVSIQ